MFTSYEKNKVFERIHQKLKQYIEHQKACKYEQAPRQNIDTLSSYTYWQQNPVEQDSIDFSMWFNS